MAEKFHSDADKTVYRSRKMGPAEAQAAPVQEAEETPAKPTPIKKTPAKSASTKKES